MEEHWRLDRLPLLSMFLQARSCSHLLGDMKPNSVLHLFVHRVPATYVTIIEDNGICLARCFFEDTVSQQKGGTDRELGLRMHRASFQITSNLVWIHW